MSDMKSLGGTVSLDKFDGQTPKGAVAMTNIIVRFAGTSGRIIAVTGHYDTKDIPKVRFVGANDGGSSTGFLVEFAHYIASVKHNDEINVIFFDGEEAVNDWTDKDSRYGSRHLAEQWLANGTLKRLKALINVDMIGDKDLDMTVDQFSSPSLRAKVQSIAARLGHGDVFRNESGIDDDHKPFADLGANVIDLIDLDYGPNNGYWHTAQDTMDKLSGRSFQVVGDLTVELVKQLDGEGGR